MRPDTVTLEFTREYLEVLVGILNKSKVQNFNGDLCFFSTFEYEPGKAYLEVVTYTDPEDHRRAAESLIEPEDY